MFFVLLPKEVKFLVESIFLKAIRGSCRCSCQKVRSNVIIVLYILYSYGLPRLSKEVEFSVESSQMMSMVVKLSSHVLYLITFLCLKGS